MKRESFLESARQLGQLVFQDTAQGRPELAALHAGVMLEHLAKGYLVGLHPAYIIRGDKGDPFDNLLKSCGHPQFVKPDHQMRTISLAEALKRTAKVLPGKFPTIDFSSVVDARDGAVHAATRPDGGAAVIRLALTATQALLSALAVAEADFWGAYADTAQEILDARADELHATVQLRIAEAKRFYAERFGPVLAEQLELLRSFLPAQQPDQDEIGVEAECPACHEKGLLIGVDELVPDPQFELGPETPHEDLLNVWGELVMFPYRFGCRYCSLALEGTDELEVVQLAAPLPLRPATAEEMHAYFEALPW